MKPLTPPRSVGVRVPDERLDEQKWRIAHALSWVPRLYREPALAELAALVADLRDARADNQRLRRAFGAYRSALLSGEPESEQMRVLAQAALAEEPRA